MPNIEHFSPFITSVMPLLPSMGTMTNVMHWHFPMAWPLAGPTGDRKDWLTTTLKVYTLAFLGRGPRPLVYPTILIPTKEVGVRATAAAEQHGQEPTTPGSTLALSRLPSVLTRPRS